MSNKLVKNSKNNNSSSSNVKTVKLKDLFSNNSASKKLFTLYEDRNKKRQAQARKGVNNIISNVIIMIALIVIATLNKLPILHIVLTLYSIIETGISVWHIVSSKENRAVWITLLVISSLFAIAGIVLYFVC